jgi:hypothetical protein
MPLKARMCSETIQRKREERNEKIIAEAGEI